MCTIKPQVVNIKQLKLISAMQPAQEMSTGFETPHVFSKQPALKIIFFLYLTGTK
jgi:hypothetical protein